MQNERISRRKALKVGAGGLAGAIAAGWTRPVMASVPVVRASHSPIPGGNPSIEVVKTVDNVTDLGDGNYEITGTITIENVTDESIPVTIVDVKDTVEVKSGGSDWTPVPTTEVVIPCEGQTIQEAGQTCSGPYKVIATIPPDANAARNVVEVKAQNRDKIFLYRADVPFNQG